MKFYCSHCGILSTGWSQCEIFSTGWPHCEVLLFTLWNIIHRVATLWNSIVHTVEYYPQGGHTVKHFPQGGHTVKFYCSHCVLFTGSHCEILSTGWPHCEMLLFTLWNIIHRVATLWNSIVHIVEYFPQGGHTVKSSFTMWASKFTLWNRTSLCEHSVVNHTVEVSTLWTQCEHSVFTESTMWTHCEHTVGHCVLSSRPPPPAPIYDNHAEWMMNNYEYFQYSTSKKHIWLSNDSKNIQYEYLGLMLHPPQPLPLPPPPPRSHVW